MSAPPLFDDLGPRGRRVTMIASVVAAVGVAGVVAVVLRRLGDTGQLDPGQWELLGRRSVVRFLWGGLANTLKAAGIAMVLATLLGAVLALARLARTAPLRWVAGLYVELFRGFPLLLLILFAFLGLPKLGVDLSRFWYLVLALVAYNGAVLGEIFRAGILSLDRGQSEAALSIGLGYWQSMRLVVIPQAVRRMVPALVSQLVTLLKDTSLGYVIGFEELLRRAQITGEFGKNALQALFAAALVYIAVNFALSLLARRLEVRQRRRYKAGGISVGGVEDLAVVGASAGAKL